MKKIITLSLLFIFLITIQVYSQNPTLDSSFGVDGKTYSSIQTGLTKIAMNSDGKILVNGYHSSFGGPAYSNVTRYNTDGSLDTTFGVNGIADTNVNSAALDLAIQSDGKFLIIGSITYANNVRNIRITRFNSNGSLDTTFGNSGHAIISRPTTNDSGLTLLIDNVGKIYVGGYIGNNSYSASIARLNPDGTVDNSFGVSGSATGNGSMTNDLAFFSDGKIIAIGDRYDGFGLTKFNTDGSKDSTFGVNGFVSTNLSSYGGIGYTHKVLVLSNDDFIVTGSIFESTKYNSVIAKYHSNGTLDTTFGVNGILKKDFGGSIGSFAKDIALDKNNHLIIGYGVGLATDWDFGVGCYNIDGTTVNSFGNNGFFIFNFGAGHDYFSTLLIQPDNKIVMGGTKGGNVLARLENSILSNNEFDNTDHLKCKLYPNPITSNSKLSFDLNDDQLLSIQLYDINGKLLKTLIEDKNYSIGHHNVNIDLLENISEGAYILKIFNTDRTINKSINILK